MPSSRTHLTSSSLYLLVPLPTIPWAVSWCPSENNCKSSTRESSLQRVNGERERKVKLKALPPAQKSFLSLCTRVYNLPQSLCVFSPVAFVSSNRHHQHKSPLHGMRGRITFSVVNNNSGTWFSRPYMSDRLWRAENVCHDGPNVMGVVVGLGD